MIQTIIVEDEITGQELLKLNIAEFFPECNIIAVVDNVKDAISSINTLRPRLVFLDIQIKGGTGFDVLEKIEYDSVKIVFVTAFSNYAIQAIKSRAVDYILKPINKTEFKATANHIRKTYFKKPEDLNFLSQSLAIKTSAGTEYIRFDQILYLKADGAYTHIQLVSNTMLSAKNIGEYENILPATSFFRCHHSYIVNTMHIEKLKKGRNGIIYLNNNHNVPISQRKMKGFNELIKTLKNNL